MYKTTSVNSQRRVEGRGVLALNGGGGEVMTEVQRLEALQASTRRLQSLIVQTPKGPARTRLVEQRRPIDLEIRELKLRLRGTPKKVAGWPSHFIEVCREQLSPWQYKRLSDEAHARAVADAERHEPVESEAERAHEAEDQAYQAEVGRNGRW